MLFLHLLNRFNGKAFKGNDFMESRQKEDEKFMRAAIDEARKALLRKEVPIGAVVVSAGSIIGRGHNLVETLGDATAHAEMQAMTAAADTIGGKYLKDCTLYVTVEPCVMCAGASAWCQMGRIVYGAPDPKKGYSKYCREITHPKTQVVTGILERECNELMTDFFKKLRE